MKPSFLTLFLVIALGAALLVIGSDDDPPRPGGDDQNAPAETAPNPDASGAGAPESGAAGHGSGSEAQPSHSAPIGSAKPAPEEDASPSRAPSARARAQVPSVAKRPGTLLHRLCGEFGWDLDGDSAAQLYGWIMERNRNVEAHAGPTGTPVIRAAAARARYNASLVDLRKQAINLFGLSTTERLLERAPLQTLGAHGRPTARLTAEGSVSILATHDEDPEEEDG